MSLGFILSVISVHFTQKSSAVFSLVAALLILGLPIFDLGMAIIVVLWLVNVFLRQISITFTIFFYGKAIHKISPYYC